MPTRNTVWPDGTPCWVDYAASDLAAAQAFYTDLLGWSYEGGEEFGGYLTCLVDGRAAAGLGPQTAAGEAPSWTTYFAAADARQVADRIHQAGGTVLVGPAPVDPEPVGLLGTVAIAADPQGHRFGLWQGAQHTGVGIYNEPGALTWNETAEQDPEAARTFYSAVFGYAFDPVEGAPGYSTFRAPDGPPDHPLGGLGGVESPDSPQGWTTCFAVADTDAAVSTVDRAGGRVVLPATDSPYGRFAVLTDPWGATFSVMGPVAEGTGG